MGGEVHYGMRSLTDVSGLESHTSLRSHLPKLAAAQLGDSLLHVFPRPDAHRQSFCTITLTDASSSIRCNWHINMQELNGLTFFRVMSSSCVWDTTALISTWRCSENLLSGGSLVDIWALIEAKPSRMMRNTPRTPLKPPSNTLQNTLVTA